jgi:hypothetical protein
MKSKIDGCLSFLLVALILSGHAETLVLDFDYAFQNTDEVCEG